MLGFWIRHGFNGANILKKSMMQTFFSPIHKVVLSDEKPEKKPVKKAKKKGDK